MNPMTMAKITLALIAAILFALGVRGESEPLRWAAIAFLALAVLLRFVDRFRKRS
jgi:hypothetical protein